MHLSEQDSSEQLNLTLRIGTSRYLSPEMALGSGNGSTYGRSTDVYSFGILFWEIVSESFDPYRHLREQEMGGTKGFRSRSRAFVDAVIHMKVAADANLRPLMGVFQECGFGDDVSQMAKKCLAHLAVNRPDFRQLADFFKTKLKEVEDEEEEEVVSQG